MVLENEKVKVMVVNVYCPNGHVYRKMYEIMAFVIKGGDFNVCVTGNDYVNRLKAANEIRLTVLN